VTNSNVVSIDEELVKNGALVVDINEVYKQTYVGVSFAHMPSSTDGLKEMNILISVS